MDDYLKTKMEKVKIWLSERWKLMLPTPEEKAAFLVLGIPQWQWRTLANECISDMMVHY